MTTILPEPTPDDPAAAALDLFTQMPTVVGHAAPDAVAAFQDLAGIMQLEGILEGMDWNDARGTVAVLGVDLMHGDPDKLLSRAAWIRTAQGAHPLHEPERVAVALERVHTIMGQPIAGSL
jgi:hypothetical protein